MSCSRNDQTHESVVDEFAPKPNESHLPQAVFSADRENMNEIATTARPSTSAWTNVDLSIFAADPSSVVNRHCRLILDEPELLGHLVVVDQDHVYITDAAERALHAECVTAAWLVFKFGASYCERIAKRKAKGKLADLLVMHREASRFEYATEKDRVPIVVTGTTESGSDGPVRVTRISLQHEVNLPCSGASLSAAHKS